MTDAGMDLKSSEPHYTFNDDKHPKNALHRETCEEIQSLQLDRIYWLNSTCINITEFDGALSTHNMFIYGKTHSEGSRC